MVLALLRIQFSNSACPYTHLRIPAARFFSPGSCENLPRSQKVQRARGDAGCTVHPRSRVQVLPRKTHTSIQVHRNHPASPHAMALRIMACSPRRDRPVCHRRRRNFFHRLAAGLWQQDHTIFSYASGANVKSTLRVHRSPPRVCDDRETPLCLGRDGENIGRISIL